MFSHYSLKSTQWTYRLENRWNKFPKYVTYEPWTFSFHKLTVLKYGTGTWSLLVLYYIQQCYIMVKASMIYNVLFHPHE